MSAAPPRSTLAAGMIFAALGLVCLAGGIGLLAWRLLHPDQAAQLPQPVIATLEDTPTPGVLGTALAPPAAPVSPGALIMLPVSERPTQVTRPTPTPAPTTTETESPTGTPTPITATPAPQMQASPTRTPAWRTPAMLDTTAPQPTVTAAHTVTPNPTATPPQPTHAPERIIIERIALSAPVVPVGQHALTLDGKVFSQWDVPDQRAAGWHTNSAPPGQPGNTVLNGHHNVHGEVFRYLVVLKPGDLVTVESGPQRYHYIVVQTMTLAEQDQPIAARQDNARWILPTEDERVTLITCWPYHANTHRLVVIARPLEEVIPPPPIP